MTIEPSGNGYHAIQKSPSGKVYCGFGATRKEAVQFCLELMPRIERKRALRSRAGR